MVAATVVGVTLMLAFLGVLAFIAVRERRFIVAGVLVTVALFIAIGAISTMGDPPAEPDWPSAG